MFRTGTIYGVNGPVIYLKGNTGFKMSEMVYVGKERLVGEVIALDKDKTTIQVFEETTGLRPGETVEATGDAISVTLAPGILNNIFDGIERPLERIAENSGAFISRGVSVDSLDKEKKWKTHLTVSIGDSVHGGDIIAEVPETTAIVHKCMVPPHISGIITKVMPDGEYTIDEPLATVELSSGETIDLTMTQKWPIRVPRPTHHRFPASVPLITGQRILDTMFPIAKGGTACVPGGFGTGKTMTQHQIAKWSDADIIIYIGCGERGNEMTQVLEEFTKLVDPKSGNPLMDRTTLIANTSNMPVAAREASIYTGLTLAEYYRDMGYDVAIMADSTSRWAEALRELSGRLEEMPAEEGFPAYLASRLSAFYERAGMMHNLNGTDGSVSIIGAVSPQGGDFSEPVTQNTKRFVRCFWGLDKSLAYARHFPAIHWLTSYSEYLLAKVCRLPQSADGSFESREQPDGNRKINRKRCAAGRPETRFGNRQSHPTWIPSAKRISCRRHLCLIRKAVQDDGRYLVFISEIKSTHHTEHADFCSERRRYFRKGHCDQIRCAK